MLERTKALIFKYRNYILAAFWPGLIWDIFLNSKVSDWVVLVLGFLWIWNIFNFKLEQRVSFILATASYAVSLIFQFFKQEMIIEKGATWFFVFMLIGLIQALIEKPVNNE